MLLPICYQNFTTSLQKHFPIRNFPTPLLQEREREWPLSGKLPGRGKQHQIMMNAVTHLLSKFHNLSPKTFAYQKFWYPSPAGEGEGMATFREITGER